MKIILIGGGPSNLIAAQFLSKNHEVHLYEKGKTVGRKFLVAGNGGFNLTNEATDETLLSHYSSTPILLEALTEFDTEKVREWLSDLEIKTFVGTSGRVFPEKGVKPIHVLKKMTDRLEKQGVVFHFNAEFIGFKESNTPVFRQAEKEISPKADAYIFGLGGASWSVTGSNQDWLVHFEKLGIKTNPFQSSNCGVTIPWSEEFKKNHAGTPLKNIQVKVVDFEIKGEAVITEYGLEGNAIYPAIPSIRHFLEKYKETTIQLDLKPHNTVHQLLEKVKGKNIQPKNYAYAFNLSKMQLALLKAFTNKKEYLSVELFIKKIKNLSIPVQSLRPIEEAISTVGGIDFSEINNDFSLKKFPSIFLVGEMLDWDAPTGGFLLQACFSSGMKAAKSIQKIKENKRG